MAFRKKLYTRIEELQQDLDLWLRHYNEQREQSLTVKSLWWRRRESNLKPSFGICNLLIL